jgi:hypothetical protein
MNLTYCKKSKFESFAGNGRLSHGLTLCDFLALQWKLQCSKNFSRMWRCKLAHSNPPVWIFFLFFFFFLNKHPLTLLFPSPLLFFCYANRNYEIRYHQKKYETLMTCVVDCVWNCLVPHALPEYVEKEGIDALIDCLEVAPPFLQKYILRCLADLCNHSHRVVQEVNGWISNKDSDLTFARLITQLWTKEELRLGIEQQGAIVDVRNPLVLAIEVNFKKRNQFAFLILTFPK